MHRIKGALRLFLFFIWSLLIVPPQLLILLFHKGTGAYFIPYMWHKGVCLILGIRIEVEGQPNTKQQTLFVSNHLSYLDIPVIGTVLRASFVAKKEVAKWPVFGFLSKLQQTAFIERRARAAIQEANSLSNMIESGKSLIIFPEGTSTDGKTVLPFKSSLFSMVLHDEAPNMLIQPFSIEMTLVHASQPITQDIMDIYAWHRDMETELPQHLWRFACSKGALIKLTFHPCIKPSDFSDRKILAKHCHEQVSMGIQNSDHAE